MVIPMIWPILFLMILLAVPSEAATINAVSCSSAHVQSAIDSASPGDTVAIPAGSCTWTTSVHISPTKAITLKGAGEVQTVITDGGTLSGFSSNCTIRNHCGWSALLYVGFTGTNNYVTRVTGFTIKFPPGSGNARYEIVVQGNGLDKFRIDHLTCTGSGVNRCIGTFSDDSGATDFSGLVDHVSCLINSTSSPQCFNNQVAIGAAASLAWEHPPVLGSNRATYWENITCTYQNTVSNNCFDNYNGHAFVIRYSTFTHIGIGNHGVDSARRGGRIIEVYRNTFATDEAVAYAMNWRTGPNILFDNTISSLYGGTGINISLYRTVSSNIAYGITGTNCTGSNTWDGNLGTAAQGNQGYPCLDQVGWYFPPPDGCFTLAECDRPNGLNAVYSPAFMWGNTKAGSPTTAFTGNYPASYVHINSASSPSKIDIYTDVGASCSAISCTIGVGSGTLANRPASCTTGVSFWATDQGNWNQSGDGTGSGALYKCTAANTWSLFYTPYTYPHPLQTLGTSPKSTAVVPPPTGLTVH